MRLVGYCERCQRCKRVTVSTQNLVLNRLIGICDDCAEASTDTGSSTE